MSGPAGVSAVMVSWRTGPALWEAIAATLSAPDVDELVLVDNGNPPEAEARLRALAETRADLILVAGQGNVGYSRGCNLGAAAASGAHLLFLNPDALPEPGAAAHMVAAGAGAARPWLVGALLVGPDGTEQRGCRRGALTPGSALAGYLGLHRWVPAVRDIHREREPLPAGPVAMPVVSGAAMMMRADDFAALGGFDEAYFLHVEDIDLCRRVNEAGGAVVFAPQARVMHYGSTSDAPLARVEWAKAKGFVRYFRKFATGPAGRAQAMALAPLIVAAIVGRALAYGVRNALGLGRRPPGARAYSAGRDGEAAPS